jgi:histidine triad (HIT) family protein
MSDCIFCSIAKGEIPCSKVYEDDQVLAFDDIHPMAPVHVVVIPKTHIATLMDLTPDHGPLMEAMVKAAQEVSRRKGIHEKGFRVVCNCNADGGQVVFHLHMHVLGGRPLADALG